MIEFDLDRSFEPMVNDIRDNREEEKEKREKEEKY